MAHDVFISYSSKDKTTADAVCATLENNGIRCWIAPRDILPGMEYAEALVEAIQSSRLLVLVFSSGANDSPQVRGEVERAVSRGLPVLPFRIENVPPNRAMEFFIAGRHWLDALTPPLEAHLEELAKTTKLLLSRPLPPHLDPAQPLPPDVSVPKLQPFTAAPPLAPSPPGSLPVPPRPLPDAAPPSPPPAAPPTLPPWLSMTKEQALKHIRNAWIVGIISAAVTMLVILVSAAGGTLAPGLKLDWTALLDVIVMLALSYGVARKLRWCAFGLSGYFVLNKIVMWSQGVGANPFGVIFSLVFLYYFYQGVRGTWAYQLMKGAWERSSSPAPAGAGQF
jgi:hypothetical protein